MMTILRLTWVVVCFLAAAGKLEAQEWTAQKGPGFMMETPAGWTVWPDAEKGWVHVMGRYGEDVVIWPVFLPGGPVALDTRTAASSAPLPAQSA